MVVMIILLLAPTLDAAAAQGDGADSGVLVDASAQQESCPICFEHMRPEKDLVTCPKDKRHRFHHHCIQGAFGQQYAARSCPRCMGLWPVPDLQVAQHELLIAAEEGNAQRVQGLLALPGIDVNYTNNIGNTALMRAAWYGHAAVVALLLAVDRINVNHANKYGNTALIGAAWSGHAAVVAQLLAVDGINVNHANEHGDTALIWAASNGHQPVVEQLLAVPVIAVNHADITSTTALIWAARNGHAAVVDLLRTAGAV
jgi:ankyrin repeat protein